jgi:GT2 family glycosyltransferase
VYQQDIRQPFEVIVVDNESTDATVPIIREDFSEVRLIVSENRGFGAGNNVGARTARGKYLAFVNPDTIVDLAWLRELIKPLANGGVVTTSKILLLRKPDLINTCGILIHFTGYSFTHGYERPADCFRNLVEVPGISGGAFAIRREDFHRIGGFDEQFFLYVEDTDFSWRARRAGLRIVMVPKSTARHNYDFLIDEKKLYHLEKGRVILLRKHYRVRDWLIYMPSLLVAEFLAWAWAASRGRRYVVAKARATLHGLTSPVYRVCAFPHLRLDLFATWYVPFETFTENARMRLLGRLFNIVFRMNTLGWRRVQRRSLLRFEGDDQRI